MMHGIKGLLAFWRQILITVQAYIVAITAIEHDGNEGRASSSDAAVMPPSYVKRKRNSLMLSEWITFGALGLEGC